MLNFNLIRQVFFTFRSNNRKSKVNSFNNQQYEDIIDRQQQVFEQYSKLVQRKTILKNFRQEVFKRNQISQQARQAEKLIDQQQIHLDKLVRNGSQKQIISFSKKIMSKYLNNKRIFKDNSLAHVFSDYGDYSSYNSTGTTITDKNLGQFEKLDNSSVSINTFNFIDKLSDEYEEKQQIQEQIKQKYPHSWQNISVADYGKKIQQDIDKSKYLSDLRNWNYDRYEYRKSNPGEPQDDYSSYESLIDPEKLEPGSIATLSPEAINTIYDLYLEGWNVRDISRRFGILPKRTKLCIWCRAQLYNEVIPKLGLKYYIFALKNQKQHSSETGYVDYGLDLDELRRQFLPRQIEGWNNKMLDAQRSPDQYTQSLKKLQDCKKFSKYEMVEVGTHGKYNKKYSLKQWKIYRGKGSDQYHLTNQNFRSLSKAKKKMLKSYY